jgi:hypothetical protein
MDKKLIYRILVVIYILAMVIGFTFGTGELLGAVMLTILFLFIGVIFLIVYACLGIYVAYGINLALFLLTIALLTRSIFVPFMIALLAIALIGALWNKCGRKFVSFLKNCKKKKYPVLFQVGITILFVIFFSWYAFAGGDETIYPSKNNTMEAITTSFKKGIIATVSETTTGEKETTTQEKTTKKEEETTATEGTTEGATKSNSKKSGSSSSSSATNEPSTYNNVDTIVEQKKQELGIANGGEMPSDSVEQISNVSGNMDPSTNSISATTKNIPDKTISVTDGSYSEEFSKIDREDPYKEVTTEQATTTKKTEQATTTKKTEQATTTKKTEQATTTKKTEQPTTTTSNVEASISISYTHGANVANISISLSEATDVAPEIHTEWRSGDICQSQMVLNSDGTYSLKVTVPDNFKDTLIVYVNYQEKEIGYKTKIINNLPY